MRHLPHANSQVAEVLPCLLQVLTKLERMPFVPTRAQRESPTGTGAVSQLHCDRSLGNPTNDTERGRASRRCFAQNPAELRFALDSIAVPAHDYIILLQPCIAGRTLVRHASDPDAHLLPEAQPLHILRNHVGDEHAQVAALAERQNAHPALGIALLLRAQRPGQTHGSRQHHRGNEAQCLRSHFPTLLVSRSIAPRKRGARPGPRATARVPPFANLDM